MKAIRGYAKAASDVAWFGIAIFVMAVSDGRDRHGLAAYRASVRLRGFGRDAGSHSGVVRRWAPGRSDLAGRTFLEPVLAVLLVAIPTALALHSGQTVRTMPAFMYRVFGARHAVRTGRQYTGERIQMGPPHDPTEDRKELRRPKTIDDFAGRPGRC